MGHTAAEIHSNRSLAQRKQALEGFKTGKYRVLVATDIAARGIDVKGIGLVINFDLPDNAEDYVHRIGRTGRAGQTGRAISFATPDQRNDIRAIERLIRGNLNVSKLPEKMIEIAVPTPGSYDDRRERGERAYRNDRAPRSPGGRPQGRPQRPAAGPRGPRPFKKFAPDAAPQSFTAQQASYNLPRTIIVDEEDEPAYRYEPKSRGASRRPQSRGHAKSGRRR